jgi:hypothetical protein
MNFTGSLVLADSTGWGLLFNDPQTATPAQVPARVLETGGNMYYISPGAALHCPGPHFGQDALIELLSNAGAAGVLQTSVSALHRRIEQHSSDQP